MACVTPLRLAVALEGAGWHPAASDVTDDDAGRQDDAWWGELTQEAERGKLDFVSLSAPAGSVPGDEAVRTLTRIASLTNRIGLIPTAGAHLEPAIVAALDQASSGRAGWQVDLEPVDHLAEAAATAVVGSALGWWDSDTTDSSPQATTAQPVVAALAHGAASYRFAARAADLVFVTPTDEDDARRIVSEIRSEEGALGRTGPPLRIFADLVVFLADSDAAAVERKSRMDDQVQDEFRSDAAVFIGTPSNLGRRLQVWRQAGVEGFRLRPAESTTDLQAITRGLVPSLQENDAFRRGYETRGLRSLLGLPRPDNRSRLAPPA